MKLQRLIISNFRGLKGDQNVIDFTNSNIIFLIGQNNVGKSTYLRAYEYFTNSKQNATSDDFYNNTKDNSIIIEGWFIKEEDDDENSELKGKSKEPDWLNKWICEDGFIKVRKEWKEFNSSFDKYTFSPANNNWVINGFGGLDTLFTRHAPTAISINAMEDENTLEEKVNKLIQDNYIKKIREEQSELCKEIVSKIKKLQENITDSEDVVKMNETLNRHFSEIFSDLSLRIQANKDENIKIEDAFKKNHTISVLRNNNERTDSFLQNGHGVIRQALFNFIAFLKENIEGAKKEYIILFEEPELFLHPKVAFKLRKSLYELAENSPYQILCATHSPLMIDISKPHSSLIRTTKDENENTKTYQVGENIFSKDDERKQRVQMINRFNPHICEAFYANKVMLVEGDTETIVYRELLNKFYPNEEIFVLNTGSKNNIPFFQEILTAFNIEHYVIHDIDTEKDKKGNNNSAWTLNQKIWDLIKTANTKQNGLARRYVHNINFEDAHNYTISGNKDKPLKAYEFASSINIDSDYDCLKWLKDIISEKQIIHDMNYIEANKKQ